MRPILSVPWFAAEEWPKPARGRGRSCDLLDTHAEFDRRAKVRGGTHRHRAAIGDDGRAGDGRRPWRRRRVALHRLLYRQHPQLEHARGLRRRCAQLLPLARDARVHELGAVRTHHVSAYVEVLTRSYKAPTVKQHLAAIRMLFDWLIVGRVVGQNPAAAVRGPKHFVKKGKTPVTA